MYTYAGAKLAGALSDLAGHGTQRERLGRAYAQHLSGLSVEQDVPWWFREEFANFEADLTRVGAKDDEGTIQATLDDIDDAEVEELVQRVINMYDRIAREQGPLD